MAFRFLWYSYVIFPHLVKCNQKIGAISPLNHKILIILTFLSYNKIVITLILMTIHTLNL